MAGEKQPSAKRKIVRSTKVPEMIWSQQCFHGDTSNSGWLTLRYSKDHVNAL
jgi:hypothetical protein